VVGTPVYVEYLRWVRQYSQHLAAALAARGYTIGTGGTDCHLFLVDLRSKGLDGETASRRLEAVGISVNKNTIPGDASALRPNGIRIGTPVATTRGWGIAEMDRIAEFIDRALSVVGAAEDADASVAALRKEITEFIVERDR
jgi:glycine hydroxymethyltransferase